MKKKTNKALSKNNKPTEFKSIGEILQRNIIASRKLDNAENPKRRVFANGGDPLMDILKTGSSLIPGYGPLISGGLGVMESIGNGLESLFDGGSGKVRPTYAQSSNPYGNTKFKLGGDPLKQYSAPTHENGGMNLDANMNPTTSSNIEIEKKETSHDNYIFSDTLRVSPDFTFAEKSKEIEKRYSNKKDSLSIKSKELEMNNLKARNEKLKELLQAKTNQDTQKFAYGGTPGFSADFAKGIRDNMQAIDYYNNTGDLPSGDNTPKSGMDDSIMSDTSSGDKTKSNPFNFNSLAIGAKGLAFGSKLIDSLQPVEQEKLQLNPNRDKVSNLMSNRNIDFTSMLNEINLQRNANLNSAQNSRSVNVQRALNNSIFSDAARKIMTAKLSEKDANNRYRAEEATALNNLGMQESAERVRQQNIQSQNNAAQRNIRRDLFSDLSQIGSQFNKYQVYQDMLKNNQEIANLTKQEAESLINQSSDRFIMVQDPNNPLLYKIVPKTDKTTKTTTDGK